MIDTIFITSELFLHAGAGTYTRAILEAINQIAPSNNTVVFCPYLSTSSDVLSGLELIDNQVIISKKKEPRRLKKVCNLLCTGSVFYSYSSKKDLFIIIKKNKIKTVIFARSWLVIDGINKFGTIKTVGIFHDILFQMLKSKYVLEKKEAILFKKFKIFYLIRSYYDKKCACLVDKTIVLNDRDKKLFEDALNKSPSAIIPIFCNDTFDKNRIEQVDPHKCVLLFVGAYYWPNNNGLKWFIKNVMPFLDKDIFLYVIGSNMELIKSEINYNENIIVIGSVSSVELDSYYYFADMIIAPIFEGSGMKTKTVEALMYGKPIVASKEALVGYEALKYCECNTAQEYISKINMFFHNRREYKFSFENRSLYEKKYHPNVIKEQLLNILCF